MGKLCGLGSGANAWLSRGAAWIVIDVLPWNKACNLKFGRGFCPYGVSIALQEPRRGVA
jgi:hypothetical protein